MLQPITAVYCAYVIKDRGLREYHRNWGLRPFSVLCCFSLFLFYICWHWWLELVGYIGIYRWLYSSRMPTAPYLPEASLIFPSLNILVMSRPNSPDHAQPPDTSQINQLARPSQIHSLPPRAQGSQRHGAEPYRTCETTLRA